MPLRQRVQHCGAMKTEATRLGQLQLHLPASNPLPFRRLHSLGQHLPRLDEIALKPLLERRRPPKQRLVALRNARRIALLPGLRAILRLRWLRWPCWDRWDRVGGRRGKRRLQLGPARR
eukprot:scaffold2133_cov259-Pinguiococcus_pyrenoidosus.AAC.6